MKHTLLLFLVLFLFNACNKDSAVDPGVPQSTAPALKADIGQPTPDASVSSAMDDRVPPRIRLELIKLTRILQLTERQQAAVLQILIKQYEMELQIMRRYDNPLAIRKALAQLQQRVDHAIMNLLTREQLLRWRRWKG